MDPKNETKCPGHGTLLKNWITHINSIYLTCFTVVTTEIIWTSTPVGHPQSDALSSIFTRETTAWVHIWKGWHVENIKIISSVYIWTWIKAILSRWTRFTAEEPPLSFRNVCQTPHIFSDVVSSPLLPPKEAWLMFQAQYHLGMVPHKMLSLMVLTCW